MSLAMDALKNLLLDDRAPIWIMIFAILVLSTAQYSGRWDMAVYALSFWHYMVYGLAFFWRRIPHRQFISDALLLKMLSLVALGLVFVQTLPNLLSVIVMAIGFTLNIAAARALGTDRTYYGFEIAGMPPERVTGFPFSVISHPMLIGNIVGYAGALLDPEFTAGWWPLAVLHVLLNFIILQIEIHGQKRHATGMAFSIIGLLSGAFLLLLGFFDVWRPALVTVVLALAFGIFLHRRYAGSDRLDRLWEKSS